MYITHTEKVTNFNHHNIILLDAPVILKYDN